MSLRSLSLTALAITVAGCAGMGAAGGSTTPTSGGQASLAGDAGGAPPPTNVDPELRALVTDVIAPQLCPRLVGSFVGLPGDEVAEGAAAGTLPSVGRWWIRQCEASVVDGHLSFRIAGPGFTWVKQESHGFRVRQYLMFEADAHVVTDLSLAYDPATRIASLWMAPVQPVAATITPRGGLTAEATTFFSRVVGGILELTSANADERARAEAERVGSEQLAARLGAGFTMTLALDRQQVDFMVGALARGVVPERPFPDEPGAPPWVLNQRVRIERGGVDIVGPIPPSAEPLALDFELEEGEGVVVRSACQEPVHDYLDARFRDAAAEPPPPPGTDLMTATIVGERRRIELAPSACARLLLIAPRVASDLPTRMRFRVLPIVAAGAATGATTGGSGAITVQTEPAPPAVPRVRFRLALGALSVRGQNAAGSDWDLVGGGPDVFVITYSVPGQRELDRSPVAADATEVRLSRFLPGVYAPLEHLPLRFVVMDEDTTTDELIGTAELDAAELPAHSGEITLPIVSEGATAVQVGTLRVRVEVLP